MNFILHLCAVGSLVYGADYFQPDLHSLSRNQSSSEVFNIPDSLRLVGIMVQFQEELIDNPTTSGTGLFLSENSESYNHFYNSGSLRCNGFLLDSPPHDINYFKEQLDAVGKYYETISDSTLLLSIAKIIENPAHTNGYYTVSNNMEYYAKGDELLAEFFAESLALAANEIEDHFSFEDSNITPDDLVYVVFHAGLGQDFAYPALDPTIYDLKSAYIDQDMMQGMTPAVISDVSIYTGIVLPETENIIYYNVVEDIYGNPDYGTNDLCAYQYGMTGIFSFWLGYELGLPPLYDTESGDPGVGFFGLMDYGFNNGRGVIPAPPTPWTRVKAGWSEIETINYFNNKDSILITPYSPSNNSIYKIDISEGEYFLIENRNNQIIEGYDFEYLRYLLWDNYLCENCNLNCAGIDLDEIVLNKVEINDCIQNHPLPTEKFHYFDLLDTLIKQTDNAELIINEEIEGNIFSGFQNYDIGLPGAGILIWHIKEPLKSDYYTGINNNRNKRAIQIEEADGGIDIGFESYLFGSNSNSFGWRWDYWYKDNMEYEKFNGTDSILFNNWSIPNTRTTDGAASFLSIEILNEISDSMYIKIIFDDGIDMMQLSEEPIHYLGNTVVGETASIFYGKGDVIYRHSYDTDPDSVAVFNSVSDKFIITSGNSFSITDKQYSYFDMSGTMHEEYIAPRGYILSNDTLDIADIILASSDSSLSFGDIDLDGFDEVITIENGDIFAQNSNGTYVNGFPLNGDFSGVPLIANILSDECGQEEDKPEIICREGDDIVIVSNCGKRISRLSSLDVDQQLAMVPYWDDKMALIDGSRLFLFELDMDHSYWLNARSQPSRFPMSIGSHVLPSSYHRQKAYNYPNPITEAHTTFRFFVGSEYGNIQVLIYDAAGFLIEDDLKLQHGDVTENEFNEIKWDNIQIDSGLYLAEIKRDVGASELVRLVVIK